MINVRKRVFETNSSSMHSVCISKNNNYEFPSYVYFALDDFGWQNCIYREPHKLAAYLYTAIVDYYGYENRDEIEDYKNYIYETLGKYGVDCEFEDIVWRGDDYKFNDNGYIDHVAELCDFLNDIRKSERKLIRFLFSPDSFILSGNDNSDYYFDIFPITDFSQVQRYDKGN